MALLVAIQIASPTASIGAKVLRAATQDKQSIDADKAFAEGDRLRGEWKSESLAAAIKKYERALAAWRRTKNQRKEINALKIIGDVYSILGQNKKALGYYKQALALSKTMGERKFEIDMLNSIGGISIDTSADDSERQMALDYCKQARALSKETGYRQGEAQALNNIGLFHHDLSDTTESLRLFSQALDLWRAIGDARGQAATLTNLGYTYGDSGKSQEAISHFNQALTLWREVGDHRWQALTLTAMGLNYTFLGEKQKAVDYHIQALLFLRAMGDRSSEAVALNALAYLYYDLDEKEKALDLYIQALQAFTDVERPHAQSITMGHIGEIYDSLGQKQKALDFYNRKLAIVRSLKDRRAEGYTLKDIGAVFDSMGQQAKALDYYNQAFSLSRAVGNPRGQAYALNSIGYIHERSGDKQKAIEVYNQALALIRPMEDIGGEIQTLHNIVRVTRDMDDLAKAYDQAKNLLKLVEDIRARVVSQELRASYSASVHQHYELLINVLMRLHKQNPSAGYDLAALEANERARARSLLDLLIEAGAGIRQGADPALLERERALQRALNTAAERQNNLSDGDYTEQLAAAKKEVADLVAQYEEVRGKIRTASPRYATLTQPRPLTLQEVQQQALDADTLLLEYSLGDERSYLWAITQSATTSYELPGRVEIESAAKRLYDLLTSRNRRLKAETSKQQRLRLKKSDAQCASLAAKMSRMLLGPVASLLDKKRLVIIADGAIQYVPFVALPEPDSLKAEGEPGQPLVVDHEIVSLPSVSVLAAVRKEIAGRSPAPRTVAVLADPVFEKDDTRISLSKNPRAKNIGAGGARDLVRSASESGVTDNKLRFQRLPFASEEAKAIASVVSENQCKLALDFQASHSTAVSAELSQYQIIHFATHGLLNNIHPDLSGLVLSLVDQQGNQQDGFLRLHEIYNLRLPAELVVLSACQTALGKEVKGEGLIGVTRGFMYAGAARVVASLWKIDDRASAELMKYFYEEMFGPHRLSPAAALRAAQVRMWKQQRWKLPYYWAAFLLQGEWK